MYQQIDRFNDIQEYFILSIFNAFGSPRDCICDCWRWSGSHFKLVAFLGDVPR